MTQTFWKIGKKFLTGLLVLAFVMPMVFATSANSANAQDAGGLGSVVPVGDAKNLVKNTATAFSTNAEKVRTYVLNNIAYTVAKGIARQLTTSIVNWINSGFNGSPAFVTNPTQFLINTADRIAGDLIEGSELGFLCDPFRLDIRLALGLKYRPFYDKVTCSFTGVVNNVRNSVSGFTDGNFRNGGWGSWLTLTNQPQNNVFGAYLESQNELEIRIAGQRILESKKLDWGGGFLSWETNCRDVPLPGDSGFVGPTLPGTTANAVGSGFVGPVNSGAGQVRRQQTCDIATPGSVINDQLKKALGSGIDQLNLADDFNEIVNALVVQMVTQVAGGGSNRPNTVGNTGGLKGASQASTGGGAPLTSDLARVQDNASLKNIMTGVKAELDNMISNEIRYIATKISSLNILNTTEDSVIYLRRCYDEKVNGTQIITQNQTQTRIYCLIGNVQYEGQYCNNQQVYQVQSNTLINGLTQTEAATARSRMTAAETTIQQAITPLKAPIELDIATAQTIKTGLIALQTEINTTLAQNELFINADGSLRADLSLADANANVQLLGKAQQLSNQYQALTSRNDLHREDSLLDAEYERDSVVRPQMATLMDGTPGPQGTPGISTKIEACANFPFADRQAQGGWGATQ
ncbi:MAG: hypothetical protein WC250_00565 [Candidatus Paceibacterota bacterium]|jgi:hypothetical protein